MFQQAQANIAYLSSDELRELLSNDDALEERVNEVLKNLEDQKDQILNSNRVLAEANLAKEPEFIEKRQRINELSNEGKELCMTIQKNLQDIKSKSGDMNPDTALALLQTAAAQSEEESEALVKQLMDKELTIDSFIDKFMTSRKSMHTRKLKSEKMVDLVRQSKLTQPSQRQSYPSGGGGGGIGGSGYYPSTGGLPYPPTGAPGSGGVPYPMSGMHMPMPGQFGAGQY